MKRILAPLFTLSISASTLGYVANAPADEGPCFYESRSGVNVECGLYHSEISNTRAFLETVVNRGKWTRPSERPIIIDVRSIPEYKAGHPEHAYNVPYPFIYQNCDAQGRTPDGACIKGAGGEDRILQIVDDFVAYVEMIVPNKDTPVYMMCRTGVRSVAAANRLTEAGYSTVRNMWEGWVGVNLKAPQYVSDGQEGTTIADDPVDLNHDGVLTDADKNGWINHLGLPSDSRLLPKLIYKPQAAIYDWVD
jgi:rhodanese-related sulfurtransferase